MNKWKKFNGIINSDNELVNKARNCFHNQKRRCYTKTNPRYKDNGAKGITVDYEIRDFIGWFIYHYSKYKGPNPSVGRIDHSKGYFFENIRFESLQENSLERIKRIGPTKKRRKIIIIDHENQNSFMAESALEASKITGIQAAHVSKYCNEKCKKSKLGFSLRYANAL